MKTLIIGNFKNISGYSSQLCSHILALDSAKDIEVCPRHINLLNNTNPDINPRILQLEQKSCKQPDVVVLNTLPSFYERQGPAKYVGYLMVESSNFIRSGWAKKINILDKLTVPNYFVKQAAVDSGVKIPIDIVPLALDINKFASQSEIHPIRQNHLNDYIFYTIGEFSKRKNVEAIIKAFYLAFPSSNTPVQLFIKTTPVGMSNPNTHINSVIDNVRAGLKLYKDNSRYKPVRVHCAFASEQEILSIHQSCNCFVTASRGEAWNMPLMDAALAGKTLIAPDHSGMSYINPKNAYVLSSRETPMFGHVDTLDYLYSSFENGYEINLADLVQAMQDAFTKHDLNRKKAEQAKLTAQKFSYEKVGHSYKIALESIK